MKKSYPKVRINSNIHTSLSAWDLFAEATNMIQIHPRVAAIIKALPIINRTLINRIKRGDVLRLNSGIGLFINSVNLERGSTMKYGSKSIAILTSITVQIGFQDGVVHLLLGYWPQVRWGYNPLESLSLTESILGLVFSIFLTILLAELTYQSLELRLSRYLKSKIQGVPHLFWRYCSSVEIS